MWCARPYATVTVDPGVSNLLLGETYYWEVHESNEASIWPGDTWHFTTGDFIIVDDFEKYNNNQDEGLAVFQTWIDGYDVAGNNSQVGYLNPPFMELTVVRTDSRHKQEQDGLAKLNTFSNIAPYLYHKVRSNAKRQQKSQSLNVVISLTIVLSF